jgi:hypothetical protein
MFAPKAITNILIKKAFLGRNQPNPSRLPSVARFLPKVTDTRDSEEASHGPFGEMVSKFVLILPTTRNSGFCTPL